MSWKIPLFEPNLGEQEIEAVSAVIRSGWLTQGEKTADFERRFAEAIGCRFAIAVNNCTAALHLALTSAGIGQGDDVVCPSLTFVATANAVRYCGARPVFADVHSMDSWNLSRDTIEEVLTPQTKAIIVVHYAGYMCDMAPIISLARERDITVIEDVAHAPGASRDGKYAGTWGDLGCFSFFSNKNMTTGEGGMVTTNRAELAKRIRRMRSHGMTTVTMDRHKGHAFSYDVLDLGFNYRMSELNAALGIVQLMSLERWNSERKSVVKRYRSRLQGLPQISIPFIHQHDNAAFHIMPVLLPEDSNREQIMASMKEAGIQTSIHYRPVDSFTSYRQAGLGPCDYLTNTHRIGDRALTLPLYPNMTDDNVDCVCDALASSLS